MTTDHLRRALIEAFPDAPLDLTRAFAPWGITYLDSDTFIAGTAGRGWRALEPGFLEAHDDALYFLGPKAFADLVPAYALAMLGPAHRDGVLPETLLALLRPPRRRAERARWEERHAARMGALTTDQRAALLAALAALEETGDPQLVVGAREAAEAIRRAP